VNDYDSKSELLEIVLELKTLVDGHERFDGALGASNDFVIRQ
jgi:hypothetical protein